SSASRRSSGSPSSCSSAVVPRSPSRPDGPPPSRPRAPRLRPRPVVAGLPCPTPSLVLRFDPCTSAERESKEAQTSLLLELRGSPQLLTPILPRGDQHLGQVLPAPCLVDHPAEPLERIDRGSKSLDGSR